MAAPSSRFRVSEAADSGNEERYEPVNPTAEHSRRIRKACDGCNLRKIKCEVIGNSCRSCSALEIRCTFRRPTKRRGPLSRQLLSEPEVQASHNQRDYSSFLALYDKAPPGETTQATQDSFPTMRESNHATLVTSYGGHELLSAEDICDAPTLQVLIDDYFTYIHPVIPLPHEPTFRAGFARRDDRIDKDFLALLAAMIEILVASFPRRPHQLFQSIQSRQQTPSAKALIDRCHSVFNRCRGQDYLDRPSNLMNALGSYLVGLTAGYLFEMSRQRRYLGECVMTLRILGFHHRLPPPRPLTELPDSGKEPTVDNIYQQSGLRLFWLCFVGSLSVRQLGGYDADILMPPITLAENYPALPLEVDDEFIYSGSVFPQPPGRVAALTGFNTNVKIFQAYHRLIADEQLLSRRSSEDGKAQRHIIMRALREVERAMNEAPNVLSTSNEEVHASQQRSGENDIATSLQPHTAESHPWGSAFNLSTPVSQSMRQKIMYAVQKANVNATQLATRSFIIEKFWNLRQVQERYTTLVPFSPQQSYQEPSPSGSLNVESPTFSYTPSNTENARDASLEHDVELMATARSDIIRGMAQLLRNVDQMSMEPNGLSFCNKIRQVASTLLNHEQSFGSFTQSIGSDEVKMYLHEFCEILSRLERLGPERLQTGEHAAAEGRTAHEIEEEELIHWASLREHQQKFIRSEGFLAMHNL